MNKKIVSSVVLASFLSSQTIFAQSVSPDPDPPKPSIENELPKPELLPGEKDPGLAISPMKKGQKAPFTGVLLSPAAVANVIVELKSFDERIQLEVNAAIKKEQAACVKKLADAKTACDGDKASLQSSIDEKDRSINSLNQRIKKLESEQTNPVLWTSIGAGAGIVLTVLTAFAISKATK